MKRMFVDANVFLRFLIRDDEAQRGQARELFRAASAGEVDLVAGPPALFEIAWTLRTRYKLAKDETLNLLASILGLRGLELVDHVLVDAAIRLARATGQEFADAYIAASAQASKADAIATFNPRHFDRLGTVLYDFPPPRAAGE